MWPYWSQCRALRLRWYLFQITSGISGHADVWIPLHCAEGLICPPYLQSIFVWSYEILKSKSTVHLNCRYAYVNMCTHLYNYVCLLCMSLSFFLWSISGQTRVISGMKKCEALTRNLYIVKNVNESLNISFTNSPTNYGFLTLAWSLAAKTLGWKLKQSIELIVLAGLFSFTE